jgi:hypothetical protein
MLFCTLAGSPAYLVQSTGECTGRSENMDCSMVDIDEYNLCEKHFSKYGESGGSSCTAYKEDKSRR